MAGPRPRIRRAPSLSRSSFRLLLVLVILAGSACGPGTGDPDDGADGDDSSAATAVDPGRSDATTPDLPNVLGDAERAEGWRLLFDGASLAGWRGFQQADAPDGWSVEDGTLARVGPGGDIITDEQFANFELALDWRIAPGGNSGIFYLVSEDADYVWEAAPEMQVLDDEGHADGQSELTSAGSNFALHPAPRGVVRPAGEWNHARIVVDDGHVEHWLNGERIVEYELGSEDWEQRVAASKFAEWPRYGSTRRGHIGLQDHGDPVWYRNIKIRPIR